MTARIDMTGQAFGRLTVVSIDPLSKGEVFWFCRCECGALKTVSGSRLRRGITRSCGCLMREMVGARSRRHGHKAGGGYTPEYIAWSNIIARCENPKHKAYPNYGGRGITMCVRWRASFDAFFSDVGPRPEGHSLDRIDNDRGYEPGNVRWATSSDQAKNRRRRPRNQAGQFAGPAK